MQYQRVKGRVVASVHDLEVDEVSKRADRPHLAGPAVLRQVLLHRPPQRELEPNSLTPRLARSQVRVYTLRRGSSRRSEVTQLKATILFEWKQALATTLCRLKEFSRCEGMML